MPRRLGDAGGLGGLGRRAAVGPQQRVEVAAVELIASWRDRFLTSVDDRARTLALAAASGLGG